MANENKFARCLHFIIHTEEVRQTIIQQSREREKKYIKEKEQENKFIYF